MSRTSPFSSFDPTQPEFAAHPYDTLAQARAAEPVFYSEPLGLWVVTTFEHVKSVLRDVATFSAGNAQRPVQARCPAASAILERGGFGAIPSLTSLDPPEHTRLRKHFGSVASFLPGRMETLRTWIQQQVDELIDAFIERGRADLVKELTAPLPARVIYRLIGFPEADTDRLQSWCGSRLQLNFARPSDAEQEAISRNLVEFWQYTSKFVAAKMAEPGEDYTGDLVRLHRADPQSITLPELTSYVYGLTFAGQETTVNSMSSLLRLLLSERAQWERLLREPRLTPNAVEEGLRLEPPIAAWRRIATRDTVLAGVQLKAGDQLLLHLGAAGRDSARFPEGDALDVGRANAASHLAFGFGAHYCLGNGLARMESAIVLERLLTRIPTLRLVPRQEFSYVPNLSFRGPTSVEVEWDAQGDS